MDSETDCIDTIDLPHPALAIGYKSGLRTGLDIVRLENALRIAADVVAEEGEAYLPIFERIERELHERKLKEEALCRARTISMKPNMFAFSMEVVKKGLCSLNAFSGV